MGWERSWKERWKMIKRMQEFDLKNTRRWRERGKGSKRTWNVEMQDLLSQKDRTKD